MLERLRLTREIQKQTTPANLTAIANRLLGLSSNLVARALAKAHPRLASMLLANMYVQDHGAAKETAQQLISVLKIRVSGEHLLSDRGWADLGAEVLALGNRKVVSVEVKPVFFHPIYRVFENGGQEIICSAPQVNEGHLIAIKLDPRHRFLK